MQPSVALSPSDIRPGDPVTIRYYGLLANSGAQEVYLHMGYGDPQSWSQVQDLKMQQTPKGFEKTITVNAGDYLNFCFKDAASNWDNNNGMNWTFKIQPAQTERGTESPIPTAPESKWKTMERQGPVAVDPVPITLDSYVTVLYSGMLKDARQLYIRIGYGPNWEHMQDMRMIKVGWGWEKTFKVDHDERLSFCFFDDQGNWDNNNGLNWTYSVHSGKIM